MAKIVDPDQLTRDTEVVFDTGAKTIQLVVAGNLDDTAPGQTSGVTLQAVYSFCKDRWMDQTDLNKFRFPIKAIYEAKFLMQNSWDWADVQSRDLIRDAGWKEAVGNLAEYATLISLGTMDDDASDQAYYQQEAGFDKTKIDFDKTGGLNEPILIYDGGGSDYRDYLKVFLREQGKTFDQYNLLVAQGFAALTYIAYRVPLANENDIKIEYADNQMSGGPFSAWNLQYYKGARFEKWADSINYSADDVVELSTTNRWYRAVSGNTGDEPPGASWYTYTGEKQIGANYYAFNRTISCTSAEQGDAEQIYAWAQYRLREAAEINDDPLGESYGTVSGNIGNPLCYFVGDTLHSSPGVWFQDFDPNITNAIAMWVISSALPDAGGLDSEDLPVTTVQKTFPFVAAGNMEFNTDLVDDLNAKYWMYFNSAGSAVYDSTTAEIVNNNSGDPISGGITQASITFDFDYDGNIQAGRTGGTDAPVQVVAMGLSGAEWIVAPFTITQATGLAFPVNAPTERNYVE